MNQLIAGQEDKLNMGYGERYLVARGCFCCMSKERKETWKACETILHDQLNLVNMVKKINKGKLTLNDKLVAIEITEENSKIDMIN